MKALAPTVIDSWHAHVYFDATSRDSALWLGRSHALNLAALTG